MWLIVRCFFFFQAEDGIRDLVRSRGLGDVYKRQPVKKESMCHYQSLWQMLGRLSQVDMMMFLPSHLCCLLYTSDAADERSSVDLGGRRIIKKKNKME